MHKIAQEIDAEFISVESQEHILHINSMREIVCVGETKGSSGACWGKHNNLTHAS